jgi:hypothetical protein
LEYETVKDEVSSQLELNKEKTLREVKHLTEKIEELNSQLQKSVFECQKKDEQNQQLR